MIKHLYGWRKCLLYRCLCMKLIKIETITIGGHKYDLINPHFMKVLDQFVIRYDEGKRWNG